MHPIERLRWIARAGGAETSLLVREAASALSGFADDPAALVTACRSLVDRHPTVGPMWWLAARCLTSADPDGEAWEVVDAISRDRTSDRLDAEIPGEATVAVLGWPEVAGDALLRRADCTILMVDSSDAWSDRPRRYGRDGLDLVDVPPAGLGAAAAAADLVIVEADAVGPDAFVAELGSRALAAVAREAGVEVWVVAAAGRVLPAKLWQALVRRVGADDEPWLESVELVPLRAGDSVIRPGGRFGVDALVDADCPVAPELLRPLDAPGSYR